MFSRSELEVRLEHAEKDLTMMDERIKFLRAEKSDQLTMVDDLHAELGKCFGPQNHHCKRDSNFGLASVTISLAVIKAFDRFSWFRVLAHCMNLRVSCICLFIGLWYTTLLEPVVPPKMMGWVITEITVSKLEYFFLVKLFHIYKA